MRRPLPDWALPLAFLVGHAIERPLNPAAEGSAAANAIAAVAMSLPFLWRRTHPLAMVLALAAGSTFGQLYATHTDNLFSALVMLIVIGFTLARHHEGRDRWIPLVVAGATVSIAEWVFGSGDGHFVLMLMAGGAIGGGLTRRRAALTRELAERTHELEALRAEHERDAILEERRRIARELHDVVAHTVSIMVVQAGGARRQLRRDPERAVAALEQVDATGRETLAELDRLFGLLSTDALAAHGLGDLPALVARTREAGLPVELAVDGAPRPLAPGAELAAYRVVHEAHTNTLKHAGPASARVSIEWGDDAVLVVVRDTGWGVEGERGEGSRRGLEGMRERVAQHGGDVDAGPAPGGGFEVRARLPLAREEALA